MPDRIELTALRIDCIVGILESEQRTSQPLDVDIELQLDLEGAAAGDLSRSVDYAAVEAWITTLAQQGQWRLLESLGAAICRLILAPPCPQEARAEVAAVRVRMRKPEILGGRAVPGVVIARDAAWCELELASVATGVGVEVLQDTPLVGAYRVHLDPGARWSPPPGLALQLIAGRPLADGLALQAGERIARGSGVTLSNPEGQAVSFLGVSRPPLF